MYTTFFNVTHVNSGANPLIGKPSFLKIIPFDANIGGVRITTLH